MDLSLALSALQLEGNEELSEDQKSDVRHLTDMFDLPPLTVENRKYIHQTILQQVVRIERNKNNLTPYIKYSMKTEHIETDTGIIN